jgi:hypothetical protein
VTSIAKPPDDYQECLDHVAEFPAILYREVAGERATLSDFEPIGSLGEAGESRLASLSDDYGVSSYCKRKKVEDRITRLNENKSGFIAELDIRRVPAWGTIGIVKTDKSFHFDLLAEPEALVGAVTKIEKWPKR